MAIVSPAEMPVVLRVESDPIKKYVLTMFGYPTVNVEITEDQFEIILRNAGDFIAHYIPKEERLAYFYTKPLVSEYDMPDDAYWIRDVQWDPVTTAISDVFSAESYLFCFAPGLKILRDNGELVDVSEWDKEYLAKTPYGPKKLEIVYHDNLQPMMMVSYEGGHVKCTPNHVIKTNGLDDMLNDWIPADQCDGKTNSSGSIMTSVVTEDAPSYTIKAVGADCFYGCHDGSPILLH